MNHRIAVIGAGLAGIAAARTLHAAGREVRLFDKGRAPGGRLATRRAEAAGTALQWDHGAQYLRARGPAFAAALDEGGAAPWLDAARRVGVPGMSALPRALAAGLPLALGQAVTGLSGGPGAWTLDGVDGGPFAAVIVTVPPPQALPLVAPHWPAAAAALPGIRHAPCWTLLAAFATPPALPDTVRPEGDAIGWAAHDGTKPGRPPAGCWVVQAAPAFSREHLELPPEAVAPLLLAALARHAAAPLPELRHMQAHRWRFSTVEQGLGLPCLWDAALGLGLAGDGLPGGHAEAAWESGLAVARACLGAPQGGRAAAQVA